MPLISVIVPIYKVEKYINSCVDSILAQSLTDFELILVDDGSPDNCPQICDEYAKKDSRIIVIHKENGGLSDARNAGIDWAFENSDSQWLAFIDSDDYVRPQYLEKMYCACVEKDADMCMCNFDKVDENGQKTGSIHVLPEGKYTEKEDFFGILYSNWHSVVAWNKLYKKSLFNSIRYDYGKIHEDELIIHKLLAECNSICYIPDSLYVYIIRAGSIMSTEKKVLNKLTYLEINIKRYWFCKENKLLTDNRITDASYLEYVLSLEDIVGNEYMFIYKELKRQYKAVFIDSSDNHFKRRIIFDFYPLYKTIKG